MSGAPGGDSPRAVVLGAGGMLGRALVGALPDCGWNVVAAADHQACDICDEAAVRELLARARPDAVFNAAAFTNVDAAEADPDAAWRTNALGPETLARAADRQGAALVHFSTDFVFDGEQERPYDELDAPSPQGSYARSKLGGERLAAAVSRRVFVLRVGCLYGRGGRNFPSTVRARLLAGTPIRADGERLASPTWVADVVRVSTELARTESFGLYHCTAEGETTWAGFVRQMALELGVPVEGVTAVPSRELAAVGPRPRRAILARRMLKLRGLDIMPRWEDGLRAYILSEQEPS